MSKRHAACESASAYDSYALTTQVKRGLQLPGVCRHQAFARRRNGKLLRNPAGNIYAPRVPAALVNERNNEGERLSRRSAHPLLQPLRDDALQRPDQPRQQDGRDGSRHLCDA